MDAISVGTVETQARRWAEDGLRGNPDDGSFESLRERLRALVVVGLLDRGVATGILSGYGRARTLRGLGGYFPDADSATPPAPVRLARCTGEVLVSGATIVPRFVALSGDRTRLAVRIQLPTTGRRRRHHGPVFVDVHEVQLRDDRGRSLTAHFNGGGDGSQWRGWFETNPGLSPDTAWIEVEGTRIELDDAAPNATATVETFALEELPVAERAVRYLDHWTRSAFRDHSPDKLAEAAETFVACGVLPPDAPEVIYASRAHEDPALLASRRLAKRAGRRAPQPAAISVLVGVTTPPVEGVALTVTALESTPEGIEVELDGVGPVEAISHHPLRLDAVRLALSAIDDLGNQYVGHVHEYSGGSQEFSGQAKLEPPLHPAASALDLEFSTEHARAVVHVPLPDGGRS